MKFVFNYKRIYDLFETLIKTHFETAQNNCLTDYLTITNNIVQKIIILCVIISEIRRTSWPCAHMQYSDGLSAFRHNLFTRHSLLSDRSILNLYTRYKNKNGFSNFMCNKEIG